MAGVLRATAFGRSQFRNTSSAAAAGVGRGHSLLPYSLVAPIVAFEGLFVIYPIVRALLLAFHTTSFGVTKFAGLANFRAMLHDSFFWSALQTTFEFAAIMVIVWLGLGLGVALLMNWSFPGRGVVRALLTVPWAIPAVPVVLDFTLMFDPQFGVINRFAALLPGVNHHIFWLSSPTLAFVAIIMMVGWTGFPFFALVLLSSLQAISPDLYDAAKVDGADALKRFRAITIPAIQPSLALAALLGFVFAFQQFPIIYLSTGGGPGTATSTLALTVYQQGIQFFNYNLAGAMAIVGLFLALIVTVLFIVFERRLTRTRRLEANQVLL